MGFPNMPLQMAGLLLHAGLTCRAHCLASLVLSAGTSCILLTNCMCISLTLT